MIITFTSSVATYGATLFSDDSNPYDKYIRREYYE